MKKLILPVLIFLCIFGVAFWFVVGRPFIEKYTPTKEEQDLYTYYNLTSDDQVAIVLNNERIEAKGLVINDSVYLSYSFINQTLNSRVYFDYNENLLLYATDTILYQAKPDTVYEGFYDKAIYTVVDGEAYINLELAAQYSDFLYSYYENPSRIIITNSWTEQELANAVSSTEIRTLGGIKCPILKTVTTEESLIVLAKDTKWTKVVTEDGIIGYIRSNKLSDSTMYTPESTYAEENHEHLFMEDTVSMLWHQVTNKDGNAMISTYLDEIDGVNVISPTWFCLADEEGNIISNATKEYCDSCHEKGIQVWPTINDVDYTDVNVDNFLLSTSARGNLITQVIKEAIACGCDGLNVDLERMTEGGSGNSFIEFIRELSIQCAANNLILSVDNTRPYNFNYYYDRAEQALFADYIVLMAYDEHYAGSEDGSVSSIPWAEDGIKATIESGVPAEQLILGNPFYTRLWEVTAKSDTIAPENDDRLENYDIYSTIYGMGGAAKLLEEKGVTAEWNSNSKQNYAEWEDGNTTYEIWMEDTDSLKERLNLVNSYNLAGAAFWKYGLETNDVWAILSDLLK